MSADIDAASTIMEKPLANLPPPPPLAPPRKGEGNRELDKRPGPAAMQLATDRQSFLRATGRPLPPCGEGLGMGVVAASATAERLALFTLPPRSGGKGRGWGGGASG